MMGIPSFIGLNMDDIKLYRYARQVFADLSLLEGLWFDYYVMCCMNDSSVPQLNNKSIKSSWALSAQELDYFADKLFELIPIKKLQTTNGLMVVLPINK
jgi:hypothetical protein